MADTASIFNLSWCDCGECYKMPTEDDSVCCRKLLTGTFCEENGSGCVTKSPRFAEWFKTRITQQYLDRQRLVKLKWCRPLNEDSTYRRKAYIEINKWLSDNGWKKIKMYVSCDRLPSCVVWAVRQEFRAKNGIYTGYPQRNLLPSMVRCNERFDEEIGDITSCLLIVKPMTGVLSQIFRHSQTRIGITKLSSILKLKYRINQKKTDPYRLQKAVDYQPRANLLLGVAAFEGFVQSAIWHCMDVVYTQEVGIDSGLLLDYMSDKKLKVWKNSEFLSTFQFDVRGDPSPSEKKSNCDKVIKAVKDKANERQHVWMIHTLLQFHKDRVYKQLSSPTLYYIKQTLTCIYSTGFAINADDETKNVVDRLISHFANRSSWSLQIVESNSEESGQTELFNIKVTDVTTLSYLSNLFYGIRCLYAHGLSDPTVNRPRGALGSENCPKEKSDIKLRVGGRLSSDRPQAVDICVEYLWNIWEQAKTKKKSMHVDYYLCMNGLAFCRYLGQIVGKTIACLVFLKVKDNMAYDAGDKVYGLKVDDLTKIIRDVVQVPATPADLSRPTTIEQSGRRCKRHMTSDLRNEGEGPMTDDKRFKRDCYMK